MFNVKLSLDINNQQKIKIHFRKASMAFLDNWEKVET